MLEVAASSIEGLLLLLGSVAASGKVLLRALAPSWDEETFDGTYGLRKHIKHGNKKGEMLLGLPEFDKNYEECTVESTGWSSRVLAVKPFRKPKLFFGDVRITPTPTTVTWDLRSTFVWYKVNLDITRRFGSKS